MSYEKPGNVNEDEWAFVGSFSDEPEMRIVESILESAGIPVWVRGNLSSIYPFTVGIDLTAEQVIMVPAGRLEEAREVLAAARQE